MWDSILRRLGLVCVRRHREALDEAVRQAEARHFETTESYRKHAARAEAELGYAQIRLAHYLSDRGLRALVRQVEDPQTCYFTRKGTVWLDLTKLGVTVELALPKGTPPELVAREVSESVFRAILSRWQDQSLLLRRASDEDRVRSAGDDGGPAARPVASLVVEDPQAPHDS